MKKVLTVILLMVSYVSFGQSISIASSKNNELYMGIENPLEAVVESMKCSSFFITTDNGKISGKDCNYVITPNKYGYTNIFVKRIIKKDTVVIGKKVFRVRKIPLPSASIGGIKSGFINKNKLIACGGIVARFENMDFDFTIKINEFSVIISRDKTPIYKTYIKGNKFTEELISEFNKLQCNDELIFYNMTITTPSVGYINERIEPIDLTIE